MRPPHLLQAAIILTVSLFGQTANADDQPQVIVLKLDDVVAHSSTGQPPIHPGWQRVTDFLKESGLKGSYGIIGYSLEEDNEAYFDWIKNLHASGMVEFWNHGHRNRKASDKTGEFEGSFAEQLAALKRTQELAKEKLGITLNAFGPHWSGTNASTAKALGEIDELTMWFYGPKDSGKFVFPRHVNLENPTHNPDFAKFKEAYERVGQDKTCLTLQGHPRSWDEERWNNFVMIIRYLQSKGCVFMTPSQYMASVTEAGANGRSE